MNSPEMQQRFPPLPLSALLYHCYGHLCSLHMSRPGYQHYPLAYMPTPTYQGNMLLISYAQHLLKIVYLWCKVRSKFDSLSLARSRWCFVF